MGDGIINPIYKMGKQSEPGNYRKITLLASLGKLFDAVMNNRLCFVKEALQLENPFQNGFKKGSQTTDNLFISNSIIKKYDALKRPLNVCYVDFKSAFDFVNRHVLLFKLISQGFDGKLFSLLRSLFKKARSYVKWNSELGELLRNTYGVLQGGVINPYLFKLYIEDMRECFGDVAGVRIGDTNINHLLQADDLIIFSETRAGLQNVLQRLVLYCRRWHLILNTDKTKVMIFNAKYEILRELNNFTFEKQAIDQVSSYKYLGVIVSNQGDRISDRYSYLKDKTLRAIIAANIYIKQAVKGQLPIHLYLKVFDTQIRPVLEYASEVLFRGNPIEELEQVHLKYLKTVLGVKQSTPTAAVLGETGRFPLHMRFQNRIVKMWVRINKLPSHHLLHKIYNESMSLGQLGHNTWAGRVEHIINKYTVDLPNRNARLLHNKDFDRINNQMRELRYNQFIQMWKLDLHQNSRWPKSDTYKIIKKIYCIEPHVLYMKNKNYQRALTRLRVSAHKLNIEIGRHRRPYIPRH